MKFKGKRVLVTGDTGFKGSWLVAWLHELGAEVHGLALPATQEKGLFEQGAWDEVIQHRDGDISSYETVLSTMQAVEPDIVFHLAAQALVRESYRTPVETMATNVMGTVHVLEALRASGRPCAAVMVTSDKCYENREQSYRYVETDPMGGYDPYSASKGCAELVVSSYRRSFFPMSGSVAVASARAGNVIGPGDWAEDRIVPDAMRAFLRGEELVVRNPGAVRPWQHVLEPLAGYLWLGDRLLSTPSDAYREGWNFGPRDESARTVGELADAMVRAFPGARWASPPLTGEPHEAHLLQLSIAKAQERLRWEPVWNFAEAVEHTVTGYMRLEAVLGDAAAVRGYQQAEIASYTAAARAAGIAWAVEA